MANRNREASTSNSLSIEDGKGEEILATKSKDDDQVVLATDSQGNSLTLLEEYARRKNSRVGPFEFALSLICATASLAFAALIYFNTH
ncbi:hypothetical protein [Pelagicoccus sp. SDUM812002]|uniref:hypothetical protein n=1 Tax=Pelagicoccus sp. SDUM812002 TaxID=3041266 RepID=UPI00280C4372|nr:hypothetical protein [Pelagicoccus sp. SDUM812002]MDQ8187456.1 hypothetical protein [Pelagicoccus sp. SDUM812002]